MYTQKIESIEKVLEILTTLSYTTRPSTEKVPELFQGLLIGSLFDKLVRMNDGTFHDALKRDIIVTLAAFSKAEIQLATKKVISASTIEITSPVALTKVISAWPVLTIANQIGMKIEDNDQFINDISLFTTAILDSNDKNVATLGNQALIRLYQLVLHANGPLKQKFISVSAKNPMIDIEIINLNLLGLFFQTFDGTNRLIGQMLQRSVNTPEGSSESWLEWVLQYNAPIQNTRRFDANKVYILPLQITDKSLPFGAGSHECPGKLWAKTMALTIVDYLRSLPIKNNGLMHYRDKKTVNATVVEFYRED